jgi:hypothetical protein
MLSLDLNKKMLTYIEDFTWTPTPAQITVSRMPLVVLAAETKRVMWRRASLYRTTGSGIGSQWTKFVSFPVLMIMTRAKPLCVGDILATTKLAGLIAVLYPQRSKILTLSSLDQMASTEPMPFVCLTTIEKGADALGHATAYPHSNSTSTTT